MQNLNALHTRVGRCCMIDCRRMKIKNRTLHKKREERGTPKFWCIIPRHQFSGLEVKPHTVNA